MKKVFSLFSLALVSAVFAAPAEDAQVILGDPAGRPGLQGAEGIFNKGEETVHQWSENGKQFIKQHGLTCKWVWLA